MPFSSAMGAVLKSRLLYLDSSSGSPIDSSGRKSEAKRVFPISLYAAIPLSVFYYENYQPVQLFGAAFELIVPNLC